MAAPSMEVPSPSSTKYLSFNEAEFPPARIRVDPSVLTAREAFEGGAKTNKIRVKLVFINAAALDIHTLTRSIDVIKFYGSGITVTGERLNFDQDLQAQADLLSRLGQTPFVVEAELALGLHNLLDTLADLGVRQVDALPRMTLDLDLSVPALFYGEPVGIQPTPVENLEKIKSHCALIGVVDFGCDFAHPNFLEGNETRLEMLYVLDENGDPIPQRSFLKGQINDYILIPQPYVMHDPHDSANQPHRAYDPERFGAHGTLVQRHVEIV